MEKVTISKKRIVELMEQGITKDEIHASEYPTLNDSQWKKVLKTCKLNTVRVKKIDFIITDDMDTELTDTVLPYGRGDSHSTDPQPLSI